MRGMVEALCTVRDLESEEAADREEEDSEENENRDRLALAFEL